MKCYHDLFTDSKILCESPIFNDVLDDYFSGRITPEDFEVRIVSTAAAMKAVRAGEREMKRGRRGRNSVMLTPGKF